jgi:hypothetical protein
MREKKNITKIWVGAIGVLCCFSLLVNGEEVKTREPDPRYATRLNATSVTAPHNLIANTISSTKINIHWQYPDAGASRISGFIVYRKKAGSQVWKKFVLADPNLRSYKDENLIPYTKYFYQVRAYSTATMSESSEAVNAITFPSYPVIFVKGPAYTTSAL